MIKDRWEVSTPQASARGLWGMLHFFIIPHEQTKPSLQFLSNFVVINASKRSHFIQIISLIDKKNKNVFVKH
jgi:hypothetical protein